MTSLSQEALPKTEKTAVVVVFRSYLRPEFEAEYWEMAGRMGLLAIAVPGYLSHKVFVAQDGERLTLVEYASEDVVREWSRDPEHIKAKKLGRQRFYSKYKVQVCSVVRQHGSNVSERDTSQATTT
jgi:heme-degrading monooxygenase HmoA